MALELLMITYKATLMGDNTVYVEYTPMNDGVTDLVKHSATLPIPLGITAACVAYMPNARQEIWNVLNNQCPGLFYL